MDEFLATHKAEESRSTNKGWANKLAAAFGLMDHADLPQAEVAFRSVYKMLRREGGSFREIFERSLGASAEELEQYIQANEALGKECQEKAAYIRKLERRLERQSLWPRFKVTAMEMTKPSFSKLGHASPFIAAAIVHAGTGITELSSLAFFAVSLFAHLHSESESHERRHGWGAILGMITLLSCMIFDLVGGNADPAKDTMREMAENNRTGVIPKLYKEFPLENYYTAALIVGKKVDQIDYRVNGRAIHRECIVYYIGRNRHVPFKKLLDPSIYEIGRYPSGESKDCAAVREYRSRMGLNL